MVLMVTGGGATFVPVKHIPLDPFNSPHPPRCQRLGYDSDGDEFRCGQQEDVPVHDPLTEDSHPFDPAPYVQRRGGNRDDRISVDKWYLAKIYGRWYLGKFGEQWYGWNFLGWVNPAGYQLDSIEDLYEVDLGNL